MEKTMILAFIGKAKDFKQENYSVNGIARKEQIE